jgi:hypothetical protein
MRVFLRHNQSNNKLNQSAAAGHVSPVGEDKRKQPSDEDERKVPAKKPRQMGGGGKLLSAPKEPPLEVRVHDENDGDAAYATGSDGGVLNEDAASDHAENSQQESQVSFLPKQ